MQAPVTAATVRVWRSIPPCPASSRAAPRSRCPVTARGPIVMPACCTLPSGYSRRAPTTPISGRNASATISRSQPGSIASTSLFSSTTTSPCASRTAALFIADQLNGPGKRSTRTRGSPASRASSRAVRRRRLSLSTISSSIAA